jgi:hypothetical protein
MLSAEKTWSDIAVTSGDLPKLEHEVEEGGVERAFRADGADTAGPERRRNLEHPPNEVVRGLLKRRALGLREPSQSEAHATGHLGQLQAGNGGHPASAEAVAAAQSHCRVIAILKRSSGEIRWSRSSAASAISSWTQSIVPLKRLPSVV